ncbi:fimbria/pilus periplasmic chaperone [Hydrogenophaga sp. SNF1]|uniref:fimbrial biogenesis chaperone n=1 Tax=Hydrogenophaga sp. SNF1 TaxID=3098762 RepID=UPI002ACBDF95|nr:fimbria/pilus periplasmic chaperone [Hydrogenophaga sp. SNF1]WQB85520.1 fimbria/pilus periplasmic chaperone [Hydrogenophaga sp. SNF1]
MKRLLAPLLAPVVLALAFPPAASAFQVRPVRLELGSRAPASQLTVHNPTTRPLLLQAEAFDWSQDGGADRLKPTQALIVNPPIFELAPGATQVVRVGLRQAVESGVERSHRLWLSQVPTPGDVDDGVQLLLRVSLPVFVTGVATPAAQPQWQRHGDTLELHNAGGRHLHVHGLQLLSDQGGSTHFGPCYALPGQGCRWTLPAGWSAATTRYDADTSAGPLRGVVDAVAPR